MSRLSPGRSSFPTTGPLGSPSASTSMSSVHMSGVTSSAGVEHESGSLWSTQLTSAIASLELELERLDAECGATDTLRNDLAYQMQNAGPFERAELALRVADAEEDLRRLHKDRAEVEQAVSALEIELASSNTRVSGRNSSDGDSPFSSPSNSFRQQKQGRSAGAGLSGNFTSPGKSVPSDEGATNYHSKRPPPSPSRSQSSRGSHRNAPRTPGGTIIHPEDVAIHVPRSSSFDDDNDGVAARSVSSRTPTLTATRVHAVDIYSKVDNDGGDRYSNVAANANDKNDIITNDSGSKHHQSGQSRKSIDRVDVLTSRCEELQQNLSRARETESKTQGRVQSLEIALERLGQSKLDTEEELLETRKRVDASKALANALDDKVKNRDNDLRQAKAKVTALESTIEESRTDFEHLAQRFARLEQENSALRDKLQHSESRIQRIGGPELTSEAVAAVSLSSVEPAQPSEVSPCLTLTASNAVEIQRGSTSIPTVVWHMQFDMLAWLQGGGSHDELGKAIGVLNGEIRSNVKTLHELRARSAQSEAEASAMERENRLVIDESLSKEREAIRALEDATKQGRVLQDEVTFLEEKLETAQRVREGLQRTVVEHQDRADQQQRELDSLRAHVTDLTNDAAKNRDEVDRLQNEIDENCNKAALEAHQAERVLEAGEEVLRLRQQLEVAQNVVAQRGRELAAAQAKLEGQTREEEKRLSREHVLREQVALAHDTSTRQEQEILRLRDTSTRQEQELARLRSHTATQEAIRPTLEMQASRDKTRIAELDREVRKLQDELKVVTSMQTAKRQTDATAAAVAQAAAERISDIPDKDDEPTTFYVL